MQLDCTKYDGKCCKTPINNFNVVLIPKEFAEVKPGYGWECYDKVQDLPITAVI